MVDWARTAKKFGVWVVVLFVASLATVHGALGQATDSDDFIIQKRDWTNLEGKKITAPVVRIQSATIVFLIEQAEVSYPIDRLSHADQELIRQFGKPTQVDSVGRRVKFLCIRANFADRLIFSQRERQWKNSIAALFAFAEPYYRVQSYGQIAKMPYDVTDVFLIDKSWTEYKGKEGKLADEMRARAQVAGWNLAEFEHVVLSFPAIDGNYGALGTPGTIWMPGDNPWPPGFAHELGHAFSLGHAGTWEGGSASWPGVHDEGSDANFTMGSGEVGAAWNLPMKFKVGWVPAEKIESVRSGTKAVYRLYQFDTPTLTDFGTVGLRAGDFWISYAPNQTHWVKDGVPRTVAQQGVFIHTLHGDITRTVDATPDSRKNPDRSQSRLDPFHDTKDAALTIGSRLIIDQSDQHPGYELCIKPLEIGKNRAFFWIDVEIDFRIRKTEHLLAADSFADAASRVTEPLSDIGWDGPWEINQSKGTRSMIAEGLKFPGLNASGGAVQLVASPVEEDTLVLSRKMSRALGTASSSVWVLFLFQAQDLQVGDLVLQLGDNPAMCFGKPWGSHFGIYTSHSSIPVQAHQTHLVVARFDFGSPESIAHIWIDPNPEATPADSAAAVVHRVGFYPAETMKIVLQGYGRGTYLIDEIRVGPSFEELTQKRNRDR